jgi:hypothetical protein
MRMLGRGDLRESPSPVSFTRMAQTPYYLSMSPRFLRTAWEHLIGRTFYENAHFANITLPRSSSLLVGQPPLLHAFQGYSLSPAMTPNCPSPQPPFQL